MLKRKNLSHRIIPKQKHKIGFTLIELLVVIGIIIILLEIVLIAIDPSKRMSQARNATRWTDVSSLLEAVLEYSVDHNGDMPTLLDGNANTYQVLGTDTTDCDRLCNGKVATASCVDLSHYLVDMYLSEIAYDPKFGDSHYSGYYINKTENGRIVIGVCNPELGATIKRSR